MVSQETHRFRYEDDAEGQEGWINTRLNIEGLSSTTASYVLMHDCLEHLNGIDRIGSYEDELMALGAGWRIRGEAGDTTPAQPNYGFVPADETWASTIYMYPARSDHLLDIDYPSYFKWETSYVDETIKWIAKRAIKIGRKEGILEGWDKAGIKHCRKTMQHLLQAGYEGVDTKYGSQKTAYNLMTHISRELGILMDHSETYDDEIEITYGWDTESLEYGYLLNKVRIDGEGEEYVDETAQHNVELLELDND